MGDEIRILGGKQQKGVQILSARTPPASVSVVPEVVVHEELVTLDQNARKNQKPGDPEIRVRSATTDDFEKIKRGEI